MQIDVNWSPEVAEEYPKLAVCIGLISGVTVQKENEQLRELKKAVYEEVRRKYSIEALKDDLTVRAYRDFYWRLDIDPTKTRPSGEALLRRVLHGDDLPNICTVVDAYNLVSMKTIVPISGFNRDRLAPPFQIRFARNDEIFTGIGISAPMFLTTKMLVLVDRKQILSIYPYRDCDYTKITMETRNAMIIGYGAPRIAQKQLTNAVETTLSFIKQVSGGEIAAMQVFQSNSG